MCLNATLGSPKAKTASAAQVIKNIVITKIIFILRIKGLIYSFNFSLNLNKFFVKRIWADISKRIKQTFSDVKSQYGDVIEDNEKIDLNIFNW